jgi:hypothetical protein
MHICYICGKDMTDGYTVAHFFEVCDTCHDEVAPAIEDGYFDWDSYLVEIDFEKGLERFLSVYA